MFDEYSYRIERAIYHNIKRSYEEHFGKLDQQQALNFFLTYVRTGQFPCWYKPVSGSG